jgi:hypothetical protein
MSHNLEQCKLNMTPKEYKALRDEEENKLLKK